MIRLPAQRRPAEADGLTTLILGAGEAGRALCSELQRVRSFGLDPIGFLDDDPGQDPEVADVPYLGVLDDLDDVIRRTRVAVVVIAIPSLSRTRIHELGIRAAAHGVTVRHLPPFLAALQREIAGTDMRALQVGALIGRQELHVTSPEIGDVITGKRVLVTGAGGSIGSELCRQVWAFRPSRLIMLDHDESNLHRLQLDLWGEAVMDSDDLVVADIRDQARVDSIFAEYEPEVVFHAAALKHLPALERHPCEGVKSNVLGTDHLVQASIKYGAERFVLVSSDKAASPVSVLGATKRAAELVLRDFPGSPTLLCAVRFGNVLGSRGSLLHVVREQLASGSPVTVTHPDVTRFFMTLEEAVGLVLEAARMADAEATYVLDMGEPVRIVELVDNFAHLLNLHSVNMRFTGLRPGEKLAEELFGADEQALPTSHPRISMTAPLPPVEGFREGLEELYAAAAENRASDVRAHLARVVPEYAPGPARVEALAVASPYPDDY